MLASKICDLEGPKKGEIFIEDSKHIQFPWELGYRLLIYIVCDLYRCINDSMRFDLNISEYDG